jgi:hypothetical protein
MMAAGNGKGTVLFSKIISLNVDNHAAIEVTVYRTPAFALGFPVAKGLARFDAIG